ncbi:MAG: TldD/PmbA family protein [Dehalococcoidia bacterium]|nr:TldD/PmbA family protein [Dehalococcoidia bacterium]
MPHIEDTAQQLAAKLSDCHADYIEAHLEDSISSYITYRGKELETIGKNASVGGNIRALVNGGWGFVSFNSLDDLDRCLKLALEEASIAGKEPRQLADVPVVVEKVEYHPDKSNPVEIPLAHKKELLDNYNAALWQVPQLQTSVISYGDGHKRNIYLNSHGSLIQQERRDVALNIAAIASDGNQVQQANMSIGSQGEFSAIQQLDEQVKELSNRAVELLAAQQAKGGEYTVVLDPILAGVFVHEAFGHLSEADFVYENKRMRDLMQLGKRFGRHELNIVDGAALSGMRGSFKYDDEGTPSGKTYLIKEGVLTSRLHSRETAAKMGEKPTGNARAINYRHAPIVRMTNTYIEPGETSFEEMIADIEEGIYAKNWYGGTTSMEMFTFSAGEAYMIRDGKIAELMRPVVLTGNVFETLKQIDAIGDDLDMNQGGGCGKGGQSPLPVSNGSPHIRIQRCLIGGK